MAKKYEVKKKELARKARAHEAIHGSAFGRDVEGGHHFGKGMPNPKVGKNETSGDRKAEMGPGK